MLREAALLPNLNRQQWGKVIKWLADDQKQLAIVKTLPIHEKIDYVLIHLAKWNLVSNILSIFSISTFNLENCVSCISNWSDIFSIVICLSYCDLYYFVSSMSGYCEQEIERSCILTKQEKKLIRLKLFDYVVCLGPSNLQNSLWIIEYYHWSDINVDDIWF